MPTTKLAAEVQTGSEVVQGLSLSLDPQVVIPDLPFLLVDVDGVLNVFGREYRDEDYDEEVVDPRFEEMFEAGGPPMWFIIRVPAGTRQRIERLEELYECVWCTTWEDKAVAELAPILGFGADWPVIHFSDGGAQRMYKTWKLPAVAKWSEEHKRPFAWIDDDLQEDCDFWVERQWQKDQRRILLVRPLSHIGLTDEHVATLEKFATNT